MPQEAFGTTQVREIRFNRKEVNQILLENIQERMSQSYDFDYALPIIINDGQEIIFRFVQRDITREREPEQVRMKSLAELKNKKA